MELEKEYDTIDWHGMWQMLRMYGVGEGVGYNWLAWYVADAKSMELEKAYDTIDYRGMWQMLKVYGVGGKLLKSVQNFNVDSKACRNGCEWVASG